MGSAVEPEISLASSEVLKLFPGLTPRKLQWWDEQEIVKAYRDGHKRMYHGQRLEMLGVVNALRRAHVSQERLRRVLRSLKQHRVLSPWLLVFRSGVVHLAAHEREVVQKLAKYGEWGAVIDVDQIRQTIREHAWK